MSGFEKTKFISLPEGMEEELTCAICLNILNDPMTTPCCRTSYCCKCIHDCLQMPANGSPTCPSCRASLAAANLVGLPLFVNNILNKLEVYCDNDLYGCVEIIKLGELKQHLTRCPFDPKSPTIKSNQLIRNINQSIDRLQIIITKQDYDNIKDALNVLQKEVAKISSTDNSNKVKQIPGNFSTLKATSKANTTIPTEAHTSQHNIIISEQTLVESARNQLNDPVIVTNNIKPIGLVSKIIKKCRQALLDSNDFKQISNYLVNNLSNNKYNWSALVYSKQSTLQLSIFQNIVYYITINFGELSIKLLSYLSYNVCYESVSADEKPSEGCATS